MLARRAHTLGGTSISWDEAGSEQRPPSEWKKTGDPNFPRQRNNNGELLVSSETCGNILLWKCRGLGPGDSPPRTPNGGTPRSSRLPLKWGRPWSGPGGSTVFRVMAQVN
ncbi:hypothetical protein NDU88_007016 [Pleurodeles waltl]|uniref:Uncharacterized protein n=1 Tax=Pleurodeles waltl TaxID=8319 RepID=A0AAV7UMQ1_PLEWA|nr:hypothetical protein NDU88_007016 [Pleurodeles waltl]